MELEMALWFKANLFMHRHPRRKAYKENKFLTKLQLKDRQTVAVKLLL